MIRSVIGTPWRQMSCVQLVNNLYSYLPNLDGTKWGRIIHLPETNLPRGGDIIVWWCPEIWAADPWMKGPVPSCPSVPCHVAVLLVPEERMILHSGNHNDDYRDNEAGSWKDRASVHVNIHDDLHPGFHVKFRAVVYRP